jgi:DNA-binding GntR family transcriptional regulator
LKELASGNLIGFSYDSIKKDVIEGALPPGSKLVVRELAERYGVSPTPVKQALNRLASEGLVESVPRRGMRLKAVTWSEICDILDMRRMMDLYFADTVMETLKDAGLHASFEKNIAEHLELAKSSADAAQYQQVYRLDQAFHRLYLQCAHNKKALWAFDTLNTHAYSTYLYERQPRVKTVEGVEEHWHIFDALRAGEGARAREAIALHYDNARDIIFLSLKAAGQI